MKINLSKRLSAVANMVPAGTTVADIGTDHGYLPAYLVLKGISPSAVASDAAEKPLEAAVQLISLLALKRKVDLRLGDGLKVLQPGEVETICMAGMGASTIIKILEQAPDVLAQVRRLVFQPMRGVPKLRIWLTEHGWNIIDEQLVFEENAFYEIISAEPGKLVLSPDEVEIGPVLIKKKPPLLKDYLEDRINELEKIHFSLKKSSSLDSEKKQRENGEKISMLKRVMECL